MPHWFDLIQFKHFRQLLIPTPVIGAGLIRTDLTGRRGRKTPHNPLGIQIFNLSTERRDNFLFRYSLPRTPQPIIPRTAPDWSQLGNEQKQQTRETERAPAKIFRCTRLRREPEFFFSLFSFLMRNGVSETLRSLALKWESCLRHENSVQTEAKDRRVHGVNVDAHRFNTRLY